MSLSVAFPDEVLVASREPPEQFRRKALIYMLGHLYEQGKISSGVAARILGCSRYEFYRLLTEHGFSVIEHDDEELQAEAATSREVASARARQ